MKKNYRRKKIAQIGYPQMTLTEFELYTAVQLDDMIQADRCIPIVETFGAKTFAAAGLRDEGHGVIIRCKDGSAFLVSIKILKPPESDNGNTG